MEGGPAQWPLGPWDVCFSLQELQRLMDTSTMQAFQPSQEKPPNLEDLLDENFSACRIYSYLGWAPPSLLECNVKCRVATFLYLALAEREAGRAN